MPTPGWAPGPFPSLEALPSTPSVAPGATAEDRAAADSDQSTADLTTLLRAQQAAASFHLGTEEGVEGTDSLIA